VSAKLSLGFAVLVAGLVGIGWSGLSRMSRINDDLEHIVKRRWPNVRIAEEALDLMNENSRISLEMCLVEGRDELATLIDRQERNRERITSFMKRIGQDLDSVEARELFGAVVVSRQRYVESFTGARQALQAGQRERGRQIVRAEVVPALDELRRAWRAYFSFENQLMNQAAETSAENYQSTRRSGVVVIVGSAVFAMLLALLVTHHLDIAFGQLRHAKDQAEATNRALSAEMQARARMELQLRQAQKLEAVGRLASGVAHEINTPVQFVNDSVHFLQEVLGDLTGLLQQYAELRAAVLDGGSAEERARALAAAEQALDLSLLQKRIPEAMQRSIDGLGRIAGIVRAMKEFGHPDETEMAPLDLNRAVGNTLTIARHEYRYVADVRTDLGELPEVRCHAGQIGQALLNLVVNAAHAVAEARRGEGPRGLITVATRHEGAFAEISVADTGGGIPAAIRDRIFDPFFTTKEVGRGTGQGLAIARAVVVERHGGELTFESDEGRGTTFLIRLPIAGRAA